MLQLQIVVAEVDRVTAEVMRQVSPLLSKAAPFPTVEVSRLITPDAGSETPAICAPLVGLVVKLPQDSVPLDGMIASGVPELRSNVSGHTVPLAKPSDPAQALLPSETKSQAAPPVLELVTAKIVPNDQSFWKFTITEAGL
jgi:hypothetical protein